MAFFDGIVKQSNMLDLDTIAVDIQHLLAKGEQVNQAYQVIQTIFIFTNKRLILMEQQGREQQRTMTTSIPYRSVVYVAMESAGALSMDSHIDIHLVSGEPISQEFKGDSDIYLVYKTLADYIL